jgi:hypothetical protein
MPSWTKNGKPSTPSNQLGHDNPTIRHTPGPKKFDHDGTPPAADNNKSNNSPKTEVGFDVATKGPNKEGSESRIAELERRIKDLTKLVVSQSGAASSKVVPEVKSKEEEEEENDSPKFDHVTGKPLNAKAVLIRDDQNDEQPRFDVTTGEPRNHAAKTAVEQALIKNTVHELNFKDYHAEQFIANSLCFFGREHWVRVYCLRLANWGMFDRYSTALYSPYCTVLHCTHHTHHTHHTALYSPYCTVLTILTILHFSPYSPCCTVLTILHYTVLYVR